MPRVLFPALLSAVCLFAVEPRPKPTDYPAHADSARLAIGAEYLVHSLSNGSQMYVTPEYLVVDTAVYPHAALDVKRNQFSLRLTLQGKAKQGDETLILHAEAPQMVAYSITSSVNSLPPEMRNPTGQRQPTPRPSDQSSPLDSGAPGPEAVTDVVTRMALPEDVMHSGQAGYLFFGFSGKTKKIKGLDLVYGDGEAALVVKLF
jgi:hypothetical protein